MHRQRSGLSHRDDRGDGTPEPVKHVIEEYRHRLRQVTCTCGWQGSSLEGDPAGWKAHLAETRKQRA